MKSVDKNTPCFSLRLFSYFFFILLDCPFSKGQHDLNKPVPKRYEIKGFVKDMQNAFFNDYANSLITGNLIHNRINFKWKLTSNLHLRIESRNRFFYGEQVKYNPDFSTSIGSDNGYFNLTYNLIKEKSFVFNSTFDRALLNWSKRKWDITMGRQRINWGINMIWNPNDIFNTLNYLDFDYEERPGSDAVRIQYNHGTFSSLQLAYKIDKNSSRKVAALMYKTHVYKYDWQNFLGIYQEDFVLGTGWAGNIKQAGFKGEASYFHSYKTLGTKSQVSISLSLDHQLKGNYFIVVSYLYNSNGKDAIYNIADVSKINLSVKNLMPFQHTIFIQASKALHPLVEGSFSAIFSPTKKSLILFPVVNISLSENWDLSVVGQSFFADLQTVYKAVGNTIFLRLRWSYLTKPI